MANARSDYAATYAGMADEELLALVHDASALTDEAMLAIREELTRRGLDIAVPDPHPSGSTRQAGQPARRSAGASLEGWLASVSANVGYDGAAVAVPSVAQLQFSTRNPDLPLPIGGWLIALIIYMQLAPALECIRIASEQLKYVNDGVSTVLSALTLGWILLKGPALFFMMLAGVALMARLPRCVALAKISLTAEMIVAFVFAVAFALYRAFFVELSPIQPPSVLVQPGQRHVLAYVLVEVHFLQSVLSGIYAALPNLAGVFYLQKSRRVRLTYPDA
jgi:hypothetical protein